MTTITCKIPERLHAQLEAAAKKQRVSKSKIIRKVLEDGLKQSRGAFKPSAHDLAKHLCGSLRGPRDLATNPKYMEGFGA